MYEVGISIFGKSKKIVQSNSLANRFRKKETATHFAVATWTSQTLFFILHHSGCVESKIGIELVEVSIFIRLRRQAVKSFGQ